MKNTREIVVASASKIKVDAVMGALDTKDLSIKTFAARSGINEQPVGVTETILGATNRLVDAKSAMPGAQLYISMENGIYRVEAPTGDMWFDQGWVIVENAGGVRSMAATASVMFDSRYVEEAKKRGFDKHTVGSVMAEILGLSSTDPHRDLTNLRTNRVSLLTEAVKIAVGQVELQKSRSTIFGSKKK